MLDCQRVGSPHQPDEHLVIFGFASKALEVHVDLGRPRPTASVPNLESDRSDHLSRGYSEQPTTTILCEWTKPYYPIGSMYGIYGNIYHQYTPNVSIYTSTMDPSWV